MNKIYKVIWSKVKHQYVVVSELAHSCTKSTSSRVGRSAAAVLAALVLTTGVGALSVQAADPLVEDPYAILNDKIDETNANSSDPIVTLKSTAAAMNTDAVPAAGSDSQSGSGGNTSVATPSGQHTILNEDGFYAHNGQGTYNSLTKDGLFVGGTNNGEGLYVDNDGNIYTDGNAEVEGLLSAANRNFEVNEDGTLYARAGQSQFQVRGDLIGIQQGNSYITVTEEDGAVFGNGTEGKETQINGDVVTTGTVNTTNLNAGKADIEGTMTAGSAVIEGTATVGGSLTAGSISTEGQLSAGSAVISGNATIDGMATVGGLTTEGTVTAANADITNLEAGKATIEGTITAGSANITNSATVGGTLTAGDIETAGTVTAANADITNLEAGKATIEGTITAGSADITNSATVGGTLTAGDIETAGTVTAANADITNLEAGKANVEGTITAGSADITNSATVGGTLTAGDIETAGTVTAANADITNLEAGKATIEGTITAGSANITNSATVGGTLTAGDIETAGTVTAANADITNLEAGKANVEGTITAGSADITNSATVGGTLTAGDIETAGTVTAANADITNLEAGKATVEGTLTAGSADITNSATVGGTLTAGDIETAGTVTAANADITNLEAGKANVEGTITAGSTDITNSATVGGTLTAGDIETAGTVTAANADITNLEAGKATVEGTLTAGSADITNSATVGGTLTAGDIETAGTVTAANADITNLEAGKATVEGKLTAGSADITGDAVVGGSLTAGSLSTEGKLTAGSAAINGNADITGTATVGDLTTAGTVTANTVDTTNLNAGKADIEGTMTAGSAAIRGNADITGMVTVGGLTTGGTVAASTVDTTNLEAGKATVEGTVRAGSFANTNGSFTVDDVGDVEANDMTAKGDVSGATFANTTNTFAVDATGNVNAADITSTGNVQATGDVKGATFSNTSNTFNVNADGGVSAADVTATGNVKGNTFGNTSGSFNVDASGNVKGATFANGNNSFSVDTKGKVSANEVEALYGVSGATFANTLETFSVDVDGNITGESVKVGDKIYISSTGLNANRQKITNVEDGNLVSGSKDAVNAGQLYDVKQSIKTYTAGDGIDITSDEISVKSADNNIVVDGTGVSLADDINVTSVTTTGAANVGGDLSVTGTTTLTGALTANGAATFTQGASMNNQKITGVLAGKEGTDAVNKDQLDAVEGKIKTYTAGDGIDITSDEISVKSADNNIVVDGTGVSLADDINVTSVTTTGAANVGGDLSVTGTTTLTGALTANGAATFTQGASMNNQKITGVLAGKEGTDAVNKDQLDAVEGKIKTYTAGDGIDITSDEISVKSADNNIVVDGTGVSLADDINVTSVTTTGAANVGGDLSVTGTTTLTGALTANGAATFTQGASMNNQKITGVLAGKEGTDAVNKDQLDAVEGKIKTYTAGDGIDITSDEISVKSADNNIVVDGTGVSLADDINVTSVTTTGAANVGGDLSVNGTTTLTGALTANGAATFMQGASMNGQKITGVATGVDGKDAVNVDQLNAAIATVDGEVYTEGNGIDIDEADNNKISVKAAADGNLEVDANGVSLKDNISLTSVMTSGAVKVGGDLGVTGTTTLTGALTANGAATFTQGASMNNQKITGVLAGKEGTDAVNKDQLDAVEGKIKTYTAGDGIDITSDEISVKSADNNIVVDGTGVSLADDINVTSVTTTGAANVGGNLSVAGTTTLTGATTINSTLGVTGAVTAASVTAGGGFTINDSNSLTSSGLTIGGTQYITSAGLNAGSKVITNVSPGNNPTDAVNMSQLSEVKEVSDLAVTYRNADKQAVDLAANGGTGTTITNVANGTLSETSKEAVNGGQLYATNQLVGNGDYSSNNFLTDKTSNGGMNLTQAASALDQAIGTNRYTGGNILNANEDGKTYTSITAAVDTLNRSIGSLTFNTPQSYFKVGTHFNDVTTALNELSGAIGPMQFDTTNNFIDNDSNLSSAIDKLDENIGSALKNVGFRTDASGKVTTDIDWTGSSISQGQTVVGAIKNIDGRVTTLETAGNALSTFSRSNISTLSALSNMDMSAVNTLSSLSADDLSKLSEISVASDGSGAAETSGTNTTNNSGRPDRGPGSGADDSISHDGDTVTVDNNVKVTGDTDLQGNLNVGGDTTLGGKLEVGGDATFNGNVDMNGTLNMNGNKITGVADGEISADSTDAVNGSQLHDAWQQINSNTENIGILGSAVNKLGDRIERVGAGAAALAALHPLDFDPDNKLDFAAGFGNYRGASAVAVGAFYRPSENVMFSVGGAFGGGEDMVNAGVSFKVGAGSGSATTSRTAMAKSLKSMQEVVASQDAQLAQQREQIDKLTAMVELLMEQNGQAQPKDGDAQAAQPQQ